MNEYFVADVAPLVALNPAVPVKVDLRPLQLADVTTLGALYFRAYDPAPTDSLDEACGEMIKAFNGEWGELWPEASLGGWIDDELVGVVQTVRRPAWDGAPDCAYIIELFVAPDCRRHGLGRALMLSAIRVIGAAGEHQVGLTADLDNDPALRLYTELGFLQTA